MLPKIAYQIKEAVAVTGVGRTNIYEEMAKGNLRSVMIAGRRLIMHDDLMAFMKEQAARSTPIRGRGAGRGMKRKALGPNQAAT